MTVERSDLEIRPITGPAELDLFVRPPYVLNDELAADLDDGHRQPGWMWVALRGDRLVARAAWWGSPERSSPALLDIFDIDDDTEDDESMQIGEQLLRTAMAAVVPSGTQPPEYVRFIPPDWRDHAASLRVVEDRMTAAERTGARLVVERLRLEWRPGTPVPARTGRLDFRPANDPGELIALMTLVMDGTLDVHGRDDLTRMTPAQAAAKHFNGELALYKSPHAWWRIASLPGGEPVGFVIPARNDYNPIIAYLGVLPAHRGHGYIGEILAEGTRILAAENVPRIRSTTDVGNVPMANAFHRAGWITFEGQISMAWPKEDASRLATS